MEIAEKGIKFIEDALERANTAVASTCRPLVLRGNDAFYSQNGAYRDPVAVLREHHKMQSALDQVVVLLEAAKANVKEKA